MEIFGRLSSVLGYFTSVDSLELINVLTEQPQTFPTEVYAHDRLITSPERPVIRSLKLRVDGQTQNHPIHQGVQLEFLTELDFSFSHPAQFRIISPIIRCAPRLKFLNLCTYKFGAYEIHEGPLVPEEWPALDLMPITSLETFSIGFMLELLPTTRDLTIWSSVLRLLSLAPSTLSNIMFSDMFIDFFLDGEKRLEMLDWELLEQSLSRFRQLKTIKITIGLNERQSETFGGSREIFEKARVIVQRQLRELHTKGKLEVALREP
ncbi:hypothetical protein NLI96_g9057 [Meripilus lineatus]|uniref:Uncharacterized protein n=1 Tax=Meripilus lineatus TaxID=2056292 RepID=A0AAD5YFM1_9APHY|nr:hypothetical protein NLI96_g9057 [Physisporinus lineatus]